jgi:hypothetical protein
MVKEKATQAAQRAKFWGEKSLGKRLERPGKIWEYKIRMEDGLNWLRLKSHAIQKNN